MRNFIIRALTGITYAALLIGCTVFSPVTAFFFFAIVAFACVWEFCGLMNRHAGASLVPPLSALAAVILVAAVWLMCIGSENAVRTIVLYGLLLMYMLISELYRRADNPLRNWALNFMAQVYVALPFALLPMLSVTYDEAASSYAYNWIYPLALFVFLWCNDTGAYLFGMALHRYIPAKKILNEHAGEHAQLAQLLVEREVIFAEDVERIFGPRPWTSRTEELLDEQKTTENEG